MYLVDVLDLDLNRHLVDVLLADPGHQLDHLPPDDLRGEEDLQPPAGCDVLHDLQVLVLRLVDARSPRRLARRPA